MGEDANDCKMIELLNKLPGPYIVNNQSTNSVSNAVDVSSSMDGDGQELIVNWLISCTILNDSVQNTY